MIERTEVETSSFMIAKAETRLSDQRARVRKLGLDRDSSRAQIADEIFASMEEAINVLRQNHVSLIANIDFKKNLTRNLLN